MSRRDCMIVARLRKAARLSSPKSYVAIAAVGRASARLRVRRSLRRRPGTQCLGQRAPNEPSRRVRCDRCGCADRFDDCAVAKAVQLIKAGSSAWIHQTFPNLRNFAWQQGYGAFSVGISQVQETVHYIEQQLEHHRTRTFQEEYLALLEKHGAHFDEKY